MKRTKWPQKKKKFRVKTKQQWIPQKDCMLLPVNLKDKMKALEQYPPDIPGFSLSRLHYLISLIVTHKQKKHSGSWSVLNMQYMNNVVPQASKYLHLLREAGIIEWINYSAGRNSRLYRLVDEGWTEEVPITDMKIIRRIEKNKASLSKRNSKKYPFLNKAINKTKIHFAEARQAIDDQYERNIDSGMAVEDAVARRTYALGAIIKIQADEKHINYSTTENRLHSNFTNLPGYLMKYCHIDSHYFVEMDISNSQPYFAGTLFNPTPEIMGVIEDYLPKSLFISIKSLLSVERQDVKLYRSLVSTGKFYEYMADQFRERGLDQEFTDRKELKTYLFRSVFFGNAYSHKYKGKDGEAAKMFEILFPSVYKVFFIIKRKQQNRLPILLQRIESYTMLERVVKEIESKHPDLDMLTKHDSILPVYVKVPDNAGYLESVRSTMVDTITEVTGLKSQGRMRKLI